MNQTTLVAAIGALGIVASAAFFFFGRAGGRAATIVEQKRAKATAEETAQRIVGDAERESESLRKNAVLSGKEELIKARESWETEARHRREEVEREERRLQDRENQLDKKFDLLDQRERDLGKRASDLGRKEKSAADREGELERLIVEERRRLEGLAGMSATEAKAELINRQGPWRTVEQVELATAEWVHFWNTRRLHSACGDVPPAEFEQAYHQRLSATTEAA